jgi:hypothetical protein
LGRTGEARFKWPQRQSRRAALSSAWSQPATVGSAPKLFTRRTVPEDRVTDIEASKVDGSYADHNNKITVAECARDWAWDPSAPPQAGRS